jgi:hypothetical protein
VCGGKEYNGGKSKRLRKDQEEYLFSGKFWIGGRGGVREVREKETSQGVIMMKGSSLRFRHEGDK